MPEKESRSLRTAFRSLRLSKQERSKGKDDGNRQDDQVLLPVVPATLFKSAAGRSMTDAGISQTAMADPISTTIESQPQKAISPPTLLASLVQEPAATPSAEYPPPATAKSSTAQEATSGQKDPAVLTTPEQLWDQAYDDLKHDESESKLFDLYESILSCRLDGSKGAKGNVIEQNRMKRRSQMDWLLGKGLDKTAMLVHVEKNIGDAINIVLSVKEAIGSALQAVPIAALAWTGVCVALQASALRYSTTSC
jgi:hypothetical protein